MDVLHVLRLFVAVLLVLLVVSLVKNYLTERRRLYEAIAMVPVPQSHCIVLFSQVNQMFWNENKKRWVTSLDLATRFDKDCAEMKARSMGFKRVYDLSL